MAAPRKNTKRLELKVDARVYDWLQEQVQNGTWSNVQQVAIAMLNKAPDTERTAAELHLAKDILRDTQGEVEVLKSKLSLWEQEVTQSREKIAAQDRLIDRLTGLIEETVQRGAIKRRKHVD